MWQNESMESIRHSKEILRTAFRHLHEEGFEFVTQDELFDHAKNVPGARSHLIQRLGSRAVNLVLFRPQPPSFKDELRKGLSELERDEALDLRYIESTEDTPSHLRYRLVEQKTNVAA